LLSVYNSDGDFIHSYGKKLIENTKNNRYNVIKFDTDSAGNIYTSFGYWPIIRKYSSEGELMWEKHINLKKLKKIIRAREIKDAVDSIPARAPNPQFFETHDTIEKNIMRTVGFVTRGLVVTDRSVFLCFNPNVILELDFDGNMICIYAFPRLDSSPVSFAVNGRDFIVTQDMTVHVFTYEK